MSRHQIKKSISVCFLFLVILVNLGLISQILPFSPFSPIVYASSTPALHTDGKYLKDSNGTIVFLRGTWKAEYLDTSTGWWTRAGLPTADGYNYLHWNETDTRAQLDVMSKPIPAYDGTLEDLVDKINSGEGGWGMNYFSTLFWGDWWLNNRHTSINFPDGTDIGLRDSIKQTLTIAQDYGIYFQIRLYSPTQAEGRMMFPYDTGEAYCSKVWQQADFVNFWANVSTELQDTYPNIILTLFDEPATLYQDVPDPLSGKSWFDTVIETVDVMRTNGYHGLVMLQWGFCGDNYWMENFYNYLGSHSRLDVLDNLVFSNHFYRYHGTFDGIGQSTDYETMKDYIYRDNEPPYWPIVGLHYNRTVNELQLPIIVSGGAFDGVNDYNEYISVRNWLLILNELEVGYSVYQFHRSELAWGIQQNSLAIQPPNRVGQAE